MTKSATDVMQEILFSAFVDSVMAMRDASKGMPNTLLRDLASVHSNSTFVDLPKEAQQAINLATRAAFNRLRKEGYTISSDDVQPKFSRRSGSPTLAPNRKGVGSKL